jgi:hypothetical protein
MRLCVATPWILARSGGMFVINDGEIKFRPWLMSDHINICIAGAGSFYFLYFCAILK